MYRSQGAVHPVAGWWKSKTILKRSLPTVRYALVVEIDAERIDTDLYAEIRTEIEALIAAENVVAV